MREATTDVAAVLPASKSLPPTSFVNAADHGPTWNAVLDEANSSGPELRAGHCCGNKDRKS